MAQPQCLYTAVQQERLNQFKKNVQNTVLNQLYKDAQPKELAQKDHQTVSNIYNKKSRSGSSRTLSSIRRMDPIYMQRKDGSFPLGNMKMLGPFSDLWVVSILGRFAEGQGFKKKRPMERRNGDVSWRTQAQRKLESPKRGIVEQNCLFRNALLL